ncbi:hypothetical protein MesoLj113c_14490 [Mesorhizobium sp. 113-3-9]|uniref:hypothetical protein n=1 Tax=Mesorhizobium sp. 113-3-9 TaxID=2744517 RepID=UPI00192799B3|nr:hypothetical protein [Mesorhizobium sp. 113-3-9]BCG85339.1 hypothetical protein MesoLj113c_14490 [Mesorhizobium sp. 113-3-9]
MNQSPMTVDAAGTVTMRHGSSYAVGEGTAWTADHVGGLFTCAGLSCTVLAVQGPTRLALSRPWAGDGIEGAQYAIEYRSDSPPHVVAIKDTMAALAAHIKVTP